MTFVLKLAAQSEHIITDYKETLLLHVSDGIINHGRSVCSRLCKKMVEFITRPLQSTLGTNVSDKLLHNGSYVHVHRICQPIMKS